MPDFSLGQLWLNALGIFPVALLAIIVCRVFPARPSTRHLVWLTVLGMFIAPSFVVGWLPHEARRDPAAYLGAASASEQRASAAPAPHDDAALPTRASLPEQPLTRLVAPRRTNDASLPGVARSRDAAMEISSPAVRPVLKPADAQWLAGVLEPVVRRAIKEAHAPATREESAHVTAPLTERASSSRAESPIARRSAEALRSAVSSGGPDQPEWAMSLLRVRDAIAALPPVPAPAWITGMGIMLAVMLWRIVSIARLVRRGTPASSSVREMVERAAIDVGLELPPDVVIVSDRVSPMMWCGRRPVLVLPAGLWSQLDGAGRYAVICHELAHLKRLDHWVCWFDMVVGVVFWWHPVAWWVRRQVREEADLCCDAWVTHLQPARRRAYAQALLDSRKYLSAMPLAGPAVGLGTATPRARRFARRLTMVMTREFVPSRSIRGATLAGALTAAGLLVSPIAACPPEEGKSLKDAKATTTLAPQTPTFFGGAAHPAPKAEPTGESSTFEQFMRERETAPEAGAFEFPSPADPFFMGEVIEADDDVEARLRRLEERLERLMQHIERMQAGQHAPSGGVTTAEPSMRSAPPAGAAMAPRGQGGVVAPPSPAPPVHTRSGNSDPGHQPMSVAAPAAPVRPGQPAPPAPPPGVRSSVGSVGSTAAVPGGVRDRTAHGGQGGGTISTTVAPRAAQSADEFAHAARAEVASGAINVADPVVVRTYRLPKGKLKELVELMIRDDVPVRVAPKDDAIEVHATEAQHRVFRMFIELIHPESVSGAAGGGPVSSTRAEQAVIAEMAALERAEAARLRDVATVRARQLEVERGAVEAMARDYATLAREKEVIAQGNVRLRTTRDELARAASEIEAHRVTLRDQMASMEADRAALTESLRRAEAMMKESGTQQRAEDIVRVEEMKARINATDAALRSQNAARQSLEAQLKALQAEIKRVEKALEEMSKGTRP